MKKVIMALVALVVLFSHGASASHLMGGEITWECLKSGPNIGRYIFTLKLYRDCNGVPGPNAVQLTSNAPGLGGGINCNLISQTDISPQGPGCPTCVAPLGLPNAVEEFVYKSGPTLIAGVPPATGWFFAYTNCCRNAAITNLVNPGSGDFALRAYMFPYNGTNTNPCFDSSPRFAERPQLSTCTRNPTTYNHNAIDEELDSLVYDWGIPLNNGFPGVPFQFSAGYTATSPLPSPLQSPQNVAAVMDPSTGAVSFTSFTPGVFVTVTKVTAWKCQQKVAEVYREIQIALLGNCNIPDPTNPVPGSTTWNTPPVVTDLLNNSLTDTLIEVVAGDTIEIPIVAFDFQWNQPTGQPLQGQRIGFFASGAQFGTNFSDPNTGCPFPPCAVFDPPPPPAFSAASNQATFKWITDCNHLPQSLGCVNLSNIYNFVIKVFDNNCPSPAVNFNTISIKVNAPPPCGPPRQRCLDVQDNGTVKLTFLPPKDLGTVDTNKYFKAFYIYRSSTGAAGPYALIDSLKGFSIANYDTVLTYTDLGANANAGPVHYYLATSSGCGLLPPTISDTLSTIYLTVAQAGTNAALTWTPFDTPLPPSTTRVYQIYRESLPPGSGVWNLIGTTANLSYNDPVTVCASLVNYRIHVVDTSAANCVSRSNISGAFLTSALPPIFSPTLLTTAVLPNGDVQICWKESQDTAQYFDKTYIYHSTSPAGPFTKIDSVDVYNTTLYNNYTHVGANANAVVNYYFLTLTAGCDAFNLIETVTTPSDTLATMLLTLNNATVGSAILNWNPVSTPLPAGSSGTYTIYRRIPPGAWAVVGNTAALTYTDPINLCDTLIEYRVEMTNAQTSCINISSVDQDIFTSLGDIIDNPEPRCLSVQANGDVVISWQPAADPTGFFAGTEIYSSTSPAGPFTLLTTINTSLPATYTHLGANANSQVIYYYLRSLSGCDGTRTNGSTSDTLATMRLTVSNATLGSAILTWNALHTPVLPSVTGPYRVMRRPTGIGAYIQIATTAALTYTDPITNCNIPYEYRIELDDNLPCTSVSSAANAVFSWIGNVVVNPDLRCVNVLPSGAIELTWIAPAGSNTDFNEYEIYRNSGAGFTLIDSVGAFNQLNYTDNAANGNTQSYAYYLLSQSGCSGQVNSPANSSTVNSIYLTTTASLGQATLNWNSMPLLPSAPVSGYDVWSSYPNGNSLSVFGSTTALTYNEPISDCDTTLQHRVSVTDGSGCVSNSNVDVNTFTYIGNLIPHPELRCASVLPNGQVQLTWVNPAPASWINFNQYNIYRNSGAGFVLVDSVENNATSTFTDIGTNANAASIQYYLQTKSGCSGQIDPSATGGASNGNTLQTIFLNLSGGNTTTALLNWNAVSSPLLPSSAAVYTIERKQPASTGAWTVAASNVAATNWQENLVLCIDSVRYRVSIADGAGCTSLSNVDTEEFVDHSIPDAPSPRCVSVQPNGQVTVNWIAPADTGQRFGMYTLYRGNSPGGPFLPVTTINSYNTLSTLDNTVNAQAASYSYVITTKTACGGEESPNSDTLQSIKVNVANNNGVAIITWNPIHNPELTTATQSYRVMKEYPAGTWTQIGTTVAPVYLWTDTINLCEAIINYRVETGDQSGCTSVSSVDGDLFRDVTRPTVSSLDSVSIDPFNPANVSVSWLPSPSGDVVGYIVYQFNGASWDSIGAIQGINGSYFLHNNPAAEFASQRYSIAAYDSCGNVSNIGVSHNTLFTTGKLDVCRGAIDLRWNPYINMVNGISQYQIFMSENGGPYTLLASVAGNNVSYSHVGLNDQTTYCYYIQAVGNTTTRTSRSNIVCVYADLLELPTFSYLKRATVLDSRRVLVECWVDVANNPDVSRYKLQRAFDPNGPYVTVNAATYTGLPLVTFIDNGAKTNQYSYYYRVITIDSCGNEVLISNLGRTILLTGQPEFNLVNELSWNFYEDWLGGVGNYALFRSVDGVWDPAPLATLNDGVLEYNDDVSALYKFPTYKGKFCYRIEAYEGPGNTYGFTDTSISNEFCLIQEPHVFVPNGFTPGGKNSLFRPEFIYVDIKNYYFAVLNRWGQKVYETRTPGEGWDGTYKGSIAPEGTYAYTIRIFGTNGQEIEKIGTVTLLR